MKRSLLSFHFFARAKVVAQWLARLPHGQEDLGSIPKSTNSFSLELAVLFFLMQAHLEKTECEKKSLSPSAKSFMAKRALMGKVRTQKTQKAHIFYFHWLFPSI